MPRRVAICAVAQTKYERDKSYQRMQGMAWEVVNKVVSDTGLDFSDNGGIEAAITVSDDLFDARTISDSADCREARWKPARWHPDASLPAPDPVR